MVLPPPRSHVVEAGGLSLAPPSWAKLAVANRVSNVARTITFRIESPGKSILPGIGRLAKIRPLHSSAQHNKAMMILRRCYVSQPLSALSAGEITFLFRFKRSVPAFR